MRNEYWWVLAGAACLWVLHRTRKRGAAIGAPKRLLFDWDKGNQDKNLDKHGITQSEIESVFYDPFRVVFADERKEDPEDRYICYGFIGSDPKHSERPLRIVFTYRIDQKGNEQIRPISARIPKGKVRAKLQKLYNLNANPKKKGRGYY